MDNEPTQLPERTETVTQKPHQREKQTNIFFTPVAVLLAGAMISGAIIFSQGRAVVPAGNVAAVAQNATGSADKIAPVSKNDHIYGN